MMITISVVLDLRLGYVNLESNSIIVFDHANTANQTNI